MAEACRNLACVGARPVGVTNCLNFGNPEKPEVMGQFEQAVTGIAEACLAFEIAGHGRQRQLLQRHRRAVHPPHSRPGDRGHHRGHPQGGDGPDSSGRGTRSSSSATALEELGGTEYLKACHGREDGRRRAIDLERKKAQPGIPARPRSKPGSSARPTTSPKAAWPWPGPNAPSTAKARLGCAIGPRRRRTRRRPPLRGIPVPHRRDVPPGERRGTAQGAVAKRAFRPRRSRRTGGDRDPDRSKGREILHVPVDEAFHAWKMQVCRPF